MRTGNNEVTDKEYVELGAKRLFRDLLYKYGGGSGI